MDSPYIIITYYNLLHDRGYNTPLFNVYINHILSHEWYIIYIPLVRVIVYKYDIPLIKKNSTKIYFSTKIVFRPKFFLTKIFFDQKFFSTKNFFRPKIFSDQNCFRPKIVFDQKVFSTKNCFRPKNVFDQKIFSTKKLSSRNSFWSKNNFGPQNFFCSNLFFIHIFWIKYQVYDHIIKRSYHGWIYIWVLSIRSDMIYATHPLRSLVAYIISSLMDKTHIQIHPWYNLYLTQSYSKMKKNQNLTILNIIQGQ